MTETKKRNASLEVAPTTSTVKLKKLDKHAKYLPLLLIYCFKFRSAF